MCLTPLLLTTADVVLLKICPQILRFSFLQEVESRFPPLESGLGFVTHFSGTE